MIRRRINITTATNGTFTGYGDPAVGFLYAIQLVDGDLADGVDVTITAEEADISIPLYAKTDFNSDMMVYPRALEVAVTDGADGSARVMPVVFGRPKVVVAQGGETKSGAVILYIVEQ